MTANPRPLTHVKAARERLMREGLINSHIPAELVPSEIEQSWRRSVSHGVNPAITPRILQDFALDPTLTSAANRVLDQWAESLDSSRMTLVLADKEGRIIARRTTDARDFKNLDHVNAVEGSDFSEKSLGTNGLGTSLESRGVVLVRGPEHFNDALDQLSCTGTPIIHPLAGRVIGSLSIAAPLDVPAALIKAMTRQAGLRIAEEVEHLADSRDLDLARAYRRMKSSRRPVLVLNSETVMTDLPALAHLDAEFHALLWEELRHHHWDSEPLHLSLPSLSADVRVRRLSTSHRDAIYAIEFLQTPLFLGAHHDAVAAKSKNQGTVVNPPNLLRAPVSASYSDVTAQLTMAAAEPGLLHLVGPSGVGKQLQAHRWMRERTAKEPVILNIQDRLGEGLSKEGIIAALKEGRGVIIVVCDVLPEQLRRRIAELAVTATGNARVLITSRAAPEEVNATVKTVTMPALAEHRSEIPGIARAMSAEIYPGAPAPKFSHDALQRLLAWPWTSNLAELHQVLSGLPQIPEGKMIQVRHLPPMMQQSLETSIGSIEDAEREAISSALREAAGNKSEAAEILGIGRTTLYRKIRSLKINLDELAIGYET